MSLINLADALFAPPFRTDDFPFATLALPALSRRMEAAHPMDIVESEDAFEVRAR